MQMKRCAVFIMAMLALFLAAMPACSADKVKITYWFFPTERNVPGYESVSANFGDWEKYLAGEFMKENPDIEITPELVPYEGGVDKVNVTIAGGNPPDIIFDYLGRSGNWYFQGAVQPVDSLISSKLKGDLLDSFKSLYTLDGKLHAVPSFAWNIGLIVNRGLLKSWGYKGEILNGPGNAYSQKQFEDFLAKVKAVAPSGCYPYALGCGSEQGDYHWWQMFWGNGAKLFNPDGTTVSSSPGLIEAYTWLKSLMDKGLIAPGVASTAAADVNSMWASGKIAMVGGHKGTAGYIEKSIKDGLLKIDYDCAIFPFPSKDGKSGYLAMGPTGYMIMAKESAKQKAAMRYIEWVMQPKWESLCSLGAGLFPTTKSVAAMNIYKADEFNSTQSAMMNKFPAGDFALADPNYNKIRIAMAACGQSIFAGMKNPKDAVADFLAEVKKIRGK
jgi:ABC-type sugar transport system, periplasmic component